MKNILKIFSASVLFIAVACNVSSTDFEENIKTVGITKIYSMPADVSKKSRAAALHPSRPLIALLTGSYDIEIWDYENNDVTTKISSPAGANDVFSSNPLSFSPDGRYLFSCLTRGEKNVVVRIWETNSWRIVHEVRDDQPTAGCQAMAISKEGMVYYVSGRTGKGQSPQIIALNIGDWKILWKNENLSYPIQLLALHPTRPELYAAAARPFNLKAQIGATDKRYHPPAGVVYKLSSLTGSAKSAIRLNFPVSAYSSMAISPDGTVIGFAYNDGLEFRESTNGTLISSIPVTSQEVRSRLMFSRNGESIYQLIESDQGGIRWSSVKGKALGGVQNGVRYLATGSSGIIALGTKYNTIIARAK